MVSLFRHVRFWRHDETDEQSGAGIEDSPVEFPWRQRWDFTPKRSAGRDFKRKDYDEARRRARETARETLGDDLWNLLQRRGYLDLPSHSISGLSYRLRVGRRIEVRCPKWVRSPWPLQYLCINPTYPLPEEEFFAQLYLYVRDREDIIFAIAVPQACDQPVVHTF